MCIITSFFAFPANCHNIYNTVIPCPLNTVATAVVLKKNKKPVFASVNFFRVFIPEQMVILVSIRSPQLPCKHLLTF